MHDPIPNKLSMFKARNHAKYAALLSKFEVRLEPNDIIKRTCRVILPKLHHGKRSKACSRIRKANRPQGAKGKRPIPTFCHDLNGHTPLKYLRCFKGMQLHRFRRDKRVDKRKICILRHRAV